MNLFPYQEEAVAFLTEKKKAYLALEQGLGKTFTSLAAAHKAGKKNVLLIAEKNEIVNSENFRRETAHFYPDLEYISLRDEDLPKAHYPTRYVCGINPDALAKHDAKEIADNFDVAIIDESTMAKNTTTARFRKIRRIASKMEHLFLLSGTPLMNGATPNRKRSIGGVGEM